MKTKLNTSKLVAVSTLALSALSLGSVAQATPPDALPTGSYTFEGKANLSKGALTANGCDLKLIGGVSNVPGTGTGGERVKIKINSGSVSGGGLCSFISLGQFPWNADKPDGEISADLAANALGPVNLVDNTAVSGGADSRVMGVYVNITFPGVGDCSGPVAAKFVNGQSSKKKGVKSCNATFEVI